MKIYLSLTACSSSPTITPDTFCSCVKSNSNPIWCTSSATYDLGTIHAVSGFVLQTLGSSTTIPAYTVSYSVDGSEWKDIPQSLVIIISIFYIKKKYGSYMICSFIWLAID